VYIFFSETGLS